jgi:MFS family permease
MDITVLKNNAEYRLLYLGQFISFIGTMLTQVGLPWQIYQLTHSSLKVGLLSLAQLFPLLLTALIGGVLADRFNRRKLAILTECCLILSCLALVVNSSLKEPFLEPIYLIAALMSAISGLHRPALESMTQQLVTKAHYKSIAALSSFKYGFCMIVGPSIGGFLIANYGITFNFIFDLVTFGISLACISLMRPLPQKEIQVHPPVFQALSQGLHFAFTRQELLGSYLIDFIAMFFAMPNALFPAIAEYLGGAKTLGFLYAAPALGALMISFFSRWMANIQQDGKAIALAAGFWGLSIIGFGLTTTLIPALIFLTLSGMFDAISGIFRSAMWNKLIPHEFRGRLAGIEMISYMGGPRLGDTRAGLVASAFGIPFALISGGAFCIIAVIGCCFLLPKYWHYSQESE